MSGALCTVPLLAVVGSIAFAAPASAETLNEALSRAYEGNPTLNAQRANTRATDEAVPQALSGYRPTVIGSADVGYSDTRVKSRTQGIRTINDSEVLTRSAGVTLNQNLFNGFQTKNTVKVAESSVLASRETLLNTEQNVLFDGVEAYMNVLRDFAIFDLRRNNVDLLGEELRATNERFQVGEVTRTDTALGRIAPRRREVGSQRRRGKSKGQPRVYRQVIGIEPTQAVSRHADRPAPAELPRCRGASRLQGAPGDPFGVSCGRCCGGCRSGCRRAYFRRPSSLQGTVSQQCDDEIGGGGGGANRTRLRQHVQWLPSSVR